MRAVLLACGLLLAGLAGSLTASAQSSTNVPSFWDPRIRLEKPDPGPPRLVRFLTDDEYPPLHFAGPEGELTGFSVELARAVCDRLGWTCTIQARRFDTLLDSLTEARGDVLAAAINLTPDIRSRFAASSLYFRNPARLATTRGNATVELDPASLNGKRIAVVGGTAHHAFLERYLPFAQRRETGTLAGALAALRSGEAEYVFADGVALAVILASESGTDLAFTGAPFLESAYFGEGVAFLLRKDDPPLKRSLDFALQSLWDDGTYARLYLRFFPVSPF